MYLNIFLCGDVMTARGIDQVLPYPGNPLIYEPYMNDARGYVTLAQRVNGSFQFPVYFNYIWGEALEEFELRKPDFRLINLETSITDNNDYWKDKGINYRMNPRNIQCLSSAGIDYCALANNHVLDWGYQGLIDTLNTLQNQKILFSGAGIQKKDALKPAILCKNEARILIFSIGTESSGIPPQWEATLSRPGVNILHGLTDNHIRQTVKWIEMFRKPHDIVILSIHWGENWVYKIPYSHVKFAHALIDSGAVDIIHGHSSHHVLAMEIYKGKPVLYGCGDFINDYEGIRGQEEFRGDISIMFFIILDSSNRNLVNITLVPLIKKQFSLKRLSDEDLKYLERKLNFLGKEFKTFPKQEGNALSMKWN